MINVDKKLITILGIILVLSAAYVIIQKAILRQAPAPASFEAQRAFNDVAEQMALGPRTPGSAAHAEVIKYIQSELQSAGWKVTLQETTLQDHPIQNILAFRNPATGPVTILGAHYDSRLKADRDADSFLATLPVPGANDGASGVAVLLELARVMPVSSSQNVWLVFFDAEDQGDLPGWNWILGSRAFVAGLTQPVKQAVIIDMIGDKNLNIYREKSSTPGLVDVLWSAADNLGYAQYFINSDKYSILDDHTPFLEAGIPAVNIIDFDYPYWHTAADLEDKVSPDSLKIVGDTLLAWLNTR
ncbi:MAG: M28 family peptidase [Anaerolineaceae bacterium]